MNENYYLNPVQLNNNAISLAGEFAVLSQLSLRGFDANLTLGRTKSVDILASYPETGKMSKLEVKTHYRYPPSNSALFGNTFDWVVTEKCERIVESNLYYCFVNIGTYSHEFRFFLLPSDIVATTVKRHHRYWLDVKGESVKDNNIRKFRLGISNHTYNIETPSAEDYENKWDLLM